MSLRVYTLNLAANGEQTQDVAGSVIAVLESASPFLLSLDGEAPFYAERGIKLKVPFGRVRVINTLATALTVRLVMGDGDFEDFRTNVRPLIASRAGNLFNAIVTSSTGPGAQLVGLANADRISVIGVAAQANVGMIYLLTQQANGTGFMALKPGEQQSIQYTGDIYITATSPGTDSAIVFATYY